MEPSNTDLSDADYNDIFLRNFGRIEIKYSRAVGEEAQVIRDLCDAIRRSMSGTHRAINAKYRSTSRIPPTLKRIANSASSYSQMPMMPPELWGKTLANTHEETEDPKHFLRRVLDNHMCKVPARHMESRQERVEYEKTCLTVLANELKEQRVINLPANFQVNVLETEFKERDFDFVMACKKYLRAEPTKTHRHEDVLQFTMRYNFPDEPVRHIHIHFNASRSEFYQFKFREGGEGGPRFQGSRVYGIARYLRILQHAFTRSRASLVTRALQNPADAAHLLQQAGLMTNVIESFNGMQAIMDDPRFGQDTRVDGDLPVGGFEPWSKYLPRYFLGVKV